MSGALGRYSLDALVMPTFASFHLLGINWGPSPYSELRWVYILTTQQVPWILRALWLMLLLLPRSVLYLFGRQWNEETLISLAYAFEHWAMIRIFGKPYSSILSPDSSSATIDNCCDQQTQTAQYCCQRLERGMSKCLSLWSWSLLLLARADSSLQCLHDCLEGHVRVRK